MSFYFSGSLSTANVNIEKQGGIVFNDDDSSNTLSILPPNAITDNFSLKLPAADGSENQVLKTDGSGNLSFTNQASGGVGDSSTTQILFNNGGTVDGIPEFTYASGAFTINTEGSFNLDGSAVTLDGTDDSNLTVTGLGKDLDIAVAGGGTQELRIASAGTGANAIKIDATAGSMLIGPSLADGKTLKLGKNGATEMVFTPHGTAASEKISLTNTNGIASDAIAITASAGGFSIDAVQASDITLASAGDADDLTIAVTGSNDASLLLSSTGTGADAVSIDASAGSMVIAPSLADGQTLKLGKNGATEMVFTPSGTAADEKISLTNTSGNASDAIAITASAGGFSIDAVQASDITLASAGDADDLTIAVTGSNDASLLLSSTGTGADAVSIDATAGSMVIAPSLADGQTLKLGKNGATEMVFTPHGTPANEKISLTNTAGTASDAIAITATAGGITATVADEKDLTLGNAGGDAYFKVAASATAGNEDVRIVNTNGTDDAAIAITATAGGVDIDAAASKDVNISGGQVALVSKEDTASAISLTANQGTSETIVITNTQGTAAGAIALTATAGGITASVADEKDLTLGNAAGDAYFKVAASATAGNEDVRIVNTNGTDDAAIAITATAGGVDVDAAAGKDINIAGGQVTLVSKDNTSNAISFFTNVGSSETIELINAQGTGAGAIDLTATVGGITLDGALITKVNTLTVANTAALDPHQLIATTNNTVHLNLTDSSGTDNAVIEVAGSNTAGQHLNLFFDNAGSNTLTLNFGGTNLTSGSGTARTLTFSQTGQSASLMYVGGKWRIINTGAAVA